MKFNENHCVHDIIISDSDEKRSHSRYIASCMMEARMDLFRAKSLYRSLWMAGLELEDVIAREHHHRCVIHSEYENSTRELRVVLDDLTFTSLLSFDW